jgi:ABC-type dipeptide/oligopeptide/nickel transport system permease component
MGAAALRRVGNAVGIVVATVIVLGLVVRLTLPNEDPTHGVLGGTARATERMLLHFDYGRGLLLPWLVVAAPIGGVVLRLTAAATRDALGGEFVRAAMARGLRRQRVVWRYAARAMRPQLPVFFGTQARVLVLNLALVEYVFGVPGFFSWIRRALGQEDFLHLYRQNLLPPDIPLLEAITV